MRNTRWRRLALVGLGLLLLVLPSQIRAQDTEALEPGAELTVYLMTFGPGDLAWERFGHNAIWIRDARRGTDIAYNYGLFDFHQENFFLRFAQGRMLYSMGGFDARQYAEFYRQENRSVWIQELNLTPAQRLELREYLEWNDQPGNRDYRYHYYRDNCSTRVRDALDRVLDGRLQEVLGDEPTGTTYRWHTRRLTTEDVPLYTGLMIGLGQPVDQPISAWEEMFLPMKVREHLRSVTVRNGSGQAVPLVGAEQTLFQAQREPLPESPPNWLVGYLLAGLGLGGALLVLGHFARSTAAARMGFAALGAVWALITGLGGAVLAALWALTDHDVAYHNENLLQFSFLSLLLVALLPGLTYGARWAIRSGRWVAFTVAGLSVAGFLLQALPGFDQVNGEMIALALPAHLGLAFAVARLSGARRKGSDKAKMNESASPSPRRGAPTV